MAGLEGVADFAASLVVALLVYQAVEDSIIEVSTVISILVFALSMGIFVISVSMAVSAALPVLRALFNYITTHPVPVDTSTTTRTVKILSYNVWFRNDMELHMRMKALGDLILSHFPDVICFQVEHKEVTSEIYDIFEKTTWWNAYHCSVLYESVKKQPLFCMQLSKQQPNSISFIPFTNSRIQKKLSMVEIEVCWGKPLVVATSHLKSHMPASGKTFSEERLVEAKTILYLLKNYPNVIFGGDMNWDEEVDGSFPLLDGWIDAWTKLRPHESGWTYDTKSNPMIPSHINHPLQKRLDRFICKFQDYKLKKIDVIGTDAIPELPGVLPSDHYGLLLEVQSK